MEEIERRIYAGQCFNNACALLAGKVYEKETISAQNVFTFAMALYNEGIKRDWLNYGKIKDNRTFAGDGSVVGSKQGSPKITPADADPEPTQEEYEAQISYVDLEKDKKQDFKVVI